jgi:hypothetical protein
MSKQDLLLVIQQSLDEDRRTPEETFQRMVAEGLIDADGHPVQRERKLVFGNRSPEPADRTE